MKNIKLPIHNIIDKMKSIVERYGAKPKLEARVFPFILGNVKGSESVVKTFNLYGHKTANRLKVAGKGMDIESISKTYARHSFNTNLAHKRVPESYIAQAMGHITGYSNTTWSIDFVNNSFESGRKFRVLNVVDDFSCMAIG